MMNALKDARKKRIGLFPAHPSQIWILKQIENSLSDKFSFLWFIRDKDISIPLANELRITYNIVSRARTGYIGNAIEMIFNTFKLISITRKYKIDLWISKYSAAHIVSRLLGKKSIFFIDDDYDLVPYLYKMSCPFADTILLPRTTRSGPYRKNLVRIDSFFELIYLHPSRFFPQQTVFNFLKIKESQKYAIVRLASLTAHHDAGVTGVSVKLLDRVIGLCKKSDIRVFITSENPVLQKFEKYRLSVPFSLIHHVLYFAEFLLGDSQTMTTEASLLGTIAFRLNSFVGKISSITEIENKGMAFGFRPGEEDRLISELEEHILNRRKKTDRSEFLKEYTDPLDIFVKSVTRLLSIEDLNT